jgi:hypothetical protein
MARKICSECRRVQKLMGSRPKKLCNCKSLAVQAHLYKKLVVATESCKIQARHDKLWPFVSSRPK